MDTRQIGGRVVALVAFPLVVLGALVLLARAAGPSDLIIVYRVAAAGLALSVIWCAVMGADLVRAVGSLLWEVGDGHAGDGRSEAMAPLEQPSFPGGTDAGLTDSSKTAAIHVANENLELLDDQLGVLEELEEAEEDPARLDKLFALDHSVARFRRAARGLVVLSNQVSASSYGGDLTAALPLVDVLTGALSSVQHFERVRIGQVADQVCANDVAEDLTHLVAELLEVSVAHAPPNEPVEIDASLSPGGSKVLIRILDGGNPKQEKRLKVTNALFSDWRQPPENPDQIGLAVATRLANRLGASLLAERGRKGTTITTVAVPSRFFGDRMGDGRPPLRPVNGVEAEAARSQNGEGAIPDTQSDFESGTNTDNWRSKLDRFRNRSSRADNPDSSSEEDAGVDEAEHLRQRPREEDSEVVSPVVDSDGIEQTEQLERTDEVPPQSLAEALALGDAIDDQIFQLLDDQNQTDDEEPRQSSTEENPPEWRSRFDSYRKGRNQSRSEHDLTSGDDHTDDEERP